FIRSGKAVSGASTLSMQVVRLLTGQPPGFLGKVKQALFAAKLERQISKGEILDLYLTLAPFGGNIEGVRAASLEYFGHEPSKLAIAEAALLVAIPQSPSLRRPGINPKALRAARDRVLLNLAGKRILASDAAQTAMLGPVPDKRRLTPHVAHHLADRLR